MQLKKNKGILIPALGNIHFIIIGAGGNGSYLVRDLARIISINNRQFNRNDKIIIIDGDKVERKNLARQNFIEADIGKNKAQVLATRYARAFGIEISYYDEYLNDDNAYDILHFRKNYGDWIVLIGCVDNNKTRHLIHRCYRGICNNVIYIDAGNEEYGGQVVFSTVKGVTITGNVVTLTCIRDIVEEFDIDDNDKHPEELSCAERAISAPQNIATNIMAADIVFSICNTIIAGAVKYSQYYHRTQEYEDFISSYEGENVISNFLKQAPLLTGHVYYFNSKTKMISVKPFDEEIQSLIASRE